MSMKMNMSPERYEQVRELFIEVCELDATARAAVLDDRCAGDADLRREIEALLAVERDQDRDRDDPLRESRLGIMAEVVHAAAEGNAEIIGTLGKYRVIRKIGAGGMGAVYEAEQDYPKRTVALKVMRPGISREKMARRFAHEAHVLGLLQHPGIAQIYDAGTAETAGGVQPYFVMELVRGQPLTDYVESRNLSTRSRLEIIAQVAEAVHHAHTKGVVHRDLKPGNILVVQENGEQGSGHPARLQPKVLDFGVASATDSDVMATTLHTDIGQLIGTVPYMSPEQASGDADQIDTRSDVYSLGVVCYELLAHRLPHDLQHAKVHEAVRMIREEDPVKLSSVDRTFRGDVETIVGKALEKDKERRYQSAADFAADIRRYLNDEPIQARPSSTMYQLRKFARRNKALVGGAMAVVLVLIAGVATTTYWLMEAVEQRNRAQDAEGLASERLAHESAALRDAEREAATAAAIVAFLDTMLVSANPDNAQGKEVAVSEVLAQASEGLGREFEGPLEVQAAIHDTIGRTYRRLGQWAQADEHLQAAVSLRRETLGPTHLRTLESLNNLAVLRKEMDRPDEALTMFRLVLEGRLAQLGENDTATLAAMNNLATTLVNQERLDEAEPLLRHAIEISEHLHGADSERTVAYLNNLGNLLVERRKFGDALEVCSRVLQSQRARFGDTHSSTLVAMSGLASVYRHLDRIDEAARLCEEVLSTRRRILGEEHPSTLVSISNLANIRKDQGRLEEAESLYREALEKQHLLLGNNHAGTQIAAHNLAQHLRAQGSFDEADSLLRMIVAAREAEFGPHHIQTLSAKSNLADMLQSADRLDEAEVMLTEVVATAEQRLSASEWVTFVFKSNYGSCLRRKGRCVEAEVQLIAAHEGLRRLLGAEHFRTQKVVQNLIDLYTACGKPEKVAEYQAILERRESTSP